MTRLAFLALVVLSFWAGPARAGEEAVLITETVQLRVADGFMAEQEYYRAITEYKRFLFLFPYSDQGDYALLRVGTAYLRGEEHNRAVRSLQELREKFPSSPLVTQSRYLEGLAAWKGKKAKQARSLFENLAQDDPGSDYAPRALAAKALIQLEEDDPQGAGQTLDLFLRVYPDHARAEQVREAGRLLEEYQTQPQKSEVLAGVLSGILPGAGYAYAGEFATGFMSLGVNGVFIAATWTAFAHGLEALGVLAGGVGLPFYIGNIYGSALAARKWNQAVKIQARAPILATLDFVFE